MKKIKYGVIKKELKEDKTKIDKHIDERKYHCISEEERKELLEVWIY